MKPPTKKQLKLIANMERLLNARFKGNTVKEASQFISSYMMEYGEAQELVFEMVYNENAY